MRYAQIRSLDISDGEGCGVALFVQGCDRHCYNCFNSETWNFNGGKAWTEEAKNKFLKLIDKTYIKRVSILGGEPLAEQNLDGVLDLIEEIRISFPEKSIWLYSGYTWNQIMYPVVTDDLNPIRDKIIQTRKDIIKNVDVLVDGEYIDEKRDVTLKWRGSSNQRVIDIKQSIAQNKVVLYCD